MDKENKNELIETVEQQRPEEFIIWELAHLKKASGLEVVGADKEQHTVTYEGENYTVSSVRIHITPEQLTLLMNFINFLQMQKGL